MKFIKGDPEAYEGVYPVGANLATWKYYCEDVAKVIAESMPTFNTDLPKRDHIALVCRGTSGNILAGIIAYLIESKYKYECDVIPIRKGKAHSSLHGEGHVLMHCDSIVVVDDFMETGKTIMEIITAINDYFLAAEIDKSQEPLHMLCVGNRWTRRRFKKIKPEIASVIHHSFKNLLFYAGH